MIPQFRQVLLGRYDVEYFLCDGCGLLQTEEPYWLDEAYQSAIALADTGILMRNASIARKLTSIIYFCLDTRAAYVDSAGGYGVLTRMMRDIGFDFFWHDDYCDNLFAQGFEQLKAPVRPCAVTAFEVLEHLRDPLSFLRDALASTTTGTLVLSTDLFDGPPPEPGTWWYYTPQTGQHISFYQRRTLEALATELGVSLHSNNNIHVLTRLKLSPRRFKAATSRWSWPMSLYATVRLDSRTLEDHALAGTAHGV